MVSVAPHTSPRQLSPPKGNMETGTWFSRTHLHRSTISFLLAGAHPTANIWRVCPGRASPATPAGGMPAPALPPAPTEPRKVPQQEHQKSSQQLKAFWRHKIDVRRRGNCQKEVGFLLSRFKWDFLRNPHFNPREDPLQSLAFSWAPVSKQTHNFSWSEGKEEASSEMPRKLD